MIGANLVAQQYSISVYTWGQQGHLGFGQYSMCCN